jgi:hypothetical protein
MTLMSRKPLLLSNVCRRERRRIRAISHILLSQIIGYARKV